MSVELWIAGAAMVGIWVGTLGAGLRYLHTVAKDARDEMRVDLIARLDEQAKNTKADHEATRKQIGDMTATISEHYLRRDDFRPAIQSFNDSIIEVRKDVGDVRNQLVDLMGRVEFRNRPR